MQVADLPLVFELSGVHTPPTGAVKSGFTGPLWRAIHLVRMEWNPDYPEWVMIRYQKPKFLVHLTEEVLPSQMGDLSIQAAALNLSQMEVVSPELPASRMVPPREL